MLLRGMSWGLALSCSLVIAAPLHAQDDAAVEAAEAAPAAEQSPEAQAAKKAFDAVYEKYVALVGEINKVRQQRDDATGPEKLQVNEQLLQLRRDAEKAIDDIVEAGVAVYAAAPDAYPEINSTLLAISQFYVLGDPTTGDGGDQYEKALAPITSMLDAGAGEQWPQLYLWGAVAAYNVNEFQLAEEYFAKAKAAGVMSADSGANRRLLSLAEQAQETLPKLKRFWVEESKIRAAEAEADDLPRVKLTTTRGDIIIELFENEAPEAVANFLTLVKDGFYNGVPFHRVLPGFMAQGGDPTGTGGGGPGYCIKCECYKPGYRRHFRGSLSMAHAGRDTGGSQFFLTFVPTSYLDGKHTVFGRVIEGMDNAAAIRRRNPDDPAAPTPDIIVSAEVLRDRGHGYDFTKLPGR